MTADFVILGLQDYDIPYIRFNTDEYPAEATVSWSVGGLGPRRLRTSAGEFSLSEVASVWYRRTGPPAVDAVETAYQEYAEKEAREALQWVWEGLEDVRWISHPAKIERAESKLRQLGYAVTAGIPIPETLLTNDREELWAFRDRVDGPVVAKALRKKLVEVEGETRAIFTSSVGNLEDEDLEGLQAAPVIFQEEVPKQADIRVTVIGDELFPTRIGSQESEGAELDWRRTSATDLEHSIHKLPTKIEDFTFQMVEDFGLKFGAFDYVLTPEGDYVFLEMNPNGQWAWIEPLTGQPLRDAMIDLLV